MENENENNPFVFDTESRRKVQQYISSHVYFIIIGLVSLICIVIPPLFYGCLSSDIGMAFPKTTEGWILWSIMNVGMSIANICILVLFKLQAKRNVRDDEGFKRGNELLNKLAGKKEAWIPRSPLAMNFGDYSKKALAIACSTIISFVTISSLILSFDWMTLLSCIISMFITIAISIVTMLNNEEYWRNEYPLYAEYKLKQIEQASQKREEGEKTECSNLETKNSD